MPVRASAGGDERAFAGAASPVLKLLVVSVTFLFIGTVQGVLQTFPAIAAWLRGAGAAGHMIDPLAHAHINLVGGVTMGMMGLFYFVLPRLVARPLYSARLADVSFWLSFCGVSLFSGSLIVLGIVEGRMVHAGMSYPQALAAVGPIHHLLIVAGGVLMGFGYWSFIANVYLSVFARRRKHATAVSASPLLKVNTP